MPPNRRGPADGNRRAFYKLKWTLSSIPRFVLEAESFLRRFEPILREASASEDPRVVRLCLQLLWFNVQELLAGGGIE